MSQCKTIPLNARVQRFCGQRLSGLLSPDMLQVLEAYLIALVRRGEQPPTHGRAIDWIALGAASNLAKDLHAPVRDALRPLLAVMLRELPEPFRPPARSPMASLREAIGRPHLACHLPSDFDRRPAAEQEEILHWIDRVIVRGATPYRRYQAEAMKVHFALGFDGEEVGGPDSDDHKCSSSQDRLRTAAPLLRLQMAQLLAFKTSTLTERGFDRSGVWGPQTAAQKKVHFGFLFGALTASPSGPIQGFGAPHGDLSLGLLVFPAVWDWYIRWRERRRGFFNCWEIDVLGGAMALVQQDSGWLRQTPRLAESLCPIAGLVSEDDIDRARRDWVGVCDSLHAHARKRVREVRRIARRHRDPFEAILPVLEADSPVAAYNRIAEEVLRRMPDPRTDPVGQAQAGRAFLMLRFGLHLGLRQKNLRQLRLCPRGRPHTRERRLEDEALGELRWSERDSVWEVFIPAVAFKNAGSSFFGKNPFRLALPDLGGLYRHLDDYVAVGRGRLLDGAPDPGTVFVKTMRPNTRAAAYGQSAFYAAWRDIIQRYGVYNPYTGRGAIEGLLPHGPHNVRDVLASHVLKQTGSYEQAGYAIQDTAAAVAKHYGRFLPGNKAELAARVLNRVWEEPCAGAAERESSLP